ncbi:hypothetical protein [Roseibium sediminicola]|uniref:Uncharacterized protein n=1 Tax=Roseibium sediminicola TaxID=2933272 RepID=A0ABT0GSB7_9HYPH|nr:hypothetical protein [Roseibium sp. CAU 1639]MCK7612329.1 hypothetical protein [Roseibium sp. CAU 1639]
MQDRFEITKDQLVQSTDPDFLAEVAVELAWMYNDTFHEVDAGNFSCLHRKNEEFGRRRSFAAEKSILRACEANNIPYKYERLECNGQRKLIVKTRNGILIQEPILTLDQKPHPSEYKKSLAESRSIIRQLELDLNLPDRPYRTLDWSGEILAVLLHAPRGPRFDEESKELGGLMLAVPNQDYSNWIVRIDIHQIAEFGLAQNAHRAGQRDQIVAKLKKNKRNEIRVSK